MAAFVGREAELAGLHAALGAPPGDRTARRRRRAGVVLVEGEAGVGKTALLDHFTDQVSADDGRFAWGAGWAGDQAPAWWPWTQALRGLLAEAPELRAGAHPDLAVVVPDAGPGPGVGAAGDRLRVFEAVGALLDRAVAGGTLVVVLDDLQWADASTVDLCRFLVGRTYAGALLLVAALRPLPAASPVREQVGQLAISAGQIRLGGLGPAEVCEVLRTVAGDGIADRWAELVHERSGGHPFFARELGHLLAAGGGIAGVPAAVRETIARRVSALSADGAALLAAAAVAGAELAPPVLAAVTGHLPSRVAELIGEAETAGLVRRGPGDPQAGRFAHDLYRESVYDSLAGSQRAELHHQVAEALIARHATGAAVHAGQVAGHLVAAGEDADPAAALLWARRAAAEDATRLAYAEAAAHLARLRAATMSPSGAELAALLAEEAGYLLRAGAADAARDLLDTAWRCALDVGDPTCLGLVALGYDRLGARFAMPRDDLIAVLDRARSALAEQVSALAARVTAALARQLQHSVAAERPRAAPLAARAVTIARTLADPASLTECLLAQHDVLWRPGTAAERLTVTTEMAAAARAAGDHERLAEAMLLTANAHLEAGSPAWRASLTEYQDAAAALRQPRQEYLLAVRRAAVALLEGDIGGGERLSAAAAELGAAVGDTDTGNVAMSQRLEIVRARGNADELRAAATAAVGWWIGAPVHAHAVAAGFSARAGDLDRARRELQVVFALPGWETERSYLWSVFVGELAVAAVALRDLELCRHLLRELAPVSTGCAVNGALVCFMGAHAHRIGLLQATLGDRSQARDSLVRALEVHLRLGARAWAAETRRALDALDDAAPAPVGQLGPAVTLRREGDLWSLGFAGHSAHLPDSKGLQDLAVLLARPGIDVPATELAGSLEVSGPAVADPVLDRRALVEYRARLAALDDELAAADTAADPERSRLATAERTALLGELRRATRPGGRPRTLGVPAVERARKAVSARIRDSIRRIHRVLPELGAHLEQTVRTGTNCRYDPRCRTEALPRRDRW